MVLDHLVFPGVYGSTSQSLLLQSTPLQSTVLQSTVYTSPCRTSTRRLCWKWLVETFFLKKILNTEISVLFGVPHYIPARVDVNADTNDTS